MAAGGAAMAAPAALGAAIGKRLGDYQDLLMIKLRQYRAWSSRT
jgi:hypothetical protein